MYNLTLLRIILEVSLLFDKANMEGPEPEIPQDKAPDSIDIFLIDSNSGINIDLSGSTTSSTTLLAL